ncbi:MAG: hypothetical protein ACI4OR_00890 [Alphaproteobacteria bacterium]
MSDTAITLCSKALIKIGAKSITSFEEETTEAEVAKQLYEPTLQSLLASYPWRFALTQKTLARLTEVPVSDYRYAYQLPNDCVRVLSAGQNVKSTGLNYKIVGLKLYANAETVILNYIFRPEENTFPAFFEDALIAKLAAEFCLPLTESTTRTDYVKKLAESSISMARLVDSQQNVSSSFQDFSLIEVRG